MQSGPVDRLGRSAANTNVRFHFLSPTCLGMFRPNSLEVGGGGAWIFYAQMCVLKV